MATGTEMMMKSLFKALGVDGDKVVAQINEIGSTITRTGNMMVAIFNLALMANRRLARIEAHMRLSDIEPVPTMMVIDNVPAKQSPGLDLPGLDHDASGR